jgi:hypothetical protein
MTQMKFAAALSVVILAMATAAPASAEEDCNWYAQTTAKQAQENTAKNCGLVGDGWSTDLKVNIAYCQAVAPEQWRADIEMRQQELQKCGG